MSKGFCEKVYPYGVSTRPLLAMAKQNLSFDNPHITQSGTKNSHRVTKYYSFPLLKSLFLNRYSIFPSTLFVTLILQSQITITTKSHCHEKDP